MTMHPNNVWIVIFNLPATSSLFRQSGSFSNFFQIILFEIRLSALWMENNPKAIFFNSFFLEHSILIALSQNQRRYKKAQNQGLPRNGRSNTTLAIKSSLLGYSKGYRFAAFSTFIFITHIPVFNNIIPVSNLTSAIKNKIETYLWEGKFYWLITFLLLINHLPDI